MKKNLLVILLVAATAMLMMGVKAPLPPAMVKVKYPKKVNTVIQNKCYGCHSPNSKGEKSRKKLNWDELGNIEKGMQLEKFQLIGKVLDAGAMPPKRMVARNPDMALSEKDTKILKKWAAKMEKKAAK